MIEKIAELFFETENMHFFKDAHPDDRAQYLATAKYALEGILKEMYAGKSLDLSGGDYSQRWRDTVRSFALREGIDIG